MGLPETTPRANEESVPELVAALPQSRSGAAALPEEKKKKKKPRVQVALNSLRVEGVEAFSRYIEAEIGEPALLRTLTERITRAQDLGDKKVPALGTVGARLRALGQSAVADMPQAVASRPDRYVERPFVAPIKTTLSYKERELISCCNSGDARRVKRLLRFGIIDVNLAIKEGTLLFLAALNGHADVVRELLSVPGVDVNLGQEKGATALFVAAQEGHLEVIKLLLDVHGINPNLGTIDEGTTPLAVAAFLGRKDVVELLLTAWNIDINIRQHDGATALFTATQGNRHEVVELLITRGADVNLGLLDDSTSLTHSAFKGNIEVLKHLLQAPGIRVNKRTKEGITALFYASKQGHAEAAELLLNKGADPELADENGVAPLHIACLLGYTGVVRALLNAGADMENMLDKVYTSYRLARMGGHREIMNLIEGYRRDRVEQALEGHVSPPIVSPASLPQAGTVTAVQPEELTSTAEVSRDCRATGDKEPAGTAQAKAAFAESSQSAPATRTRVRETDSPLAQVKHEFRQDILMRLTTDRLAGIERQKERARRRKNARRSIPAPGAQAGTPGAVPGFALGDKQDLDADAVEEEIKRHLAQSYHRFISQAVNDMEFGRGKATSGYPDLLHASAGMAGVGSCSVFYYPDADAGTIRIVGIGHHLDRGTYQLDYATAGLRGIRTIRLY